MGYVSTIFSSSLKSQMTFSLEWDLKIMDWCYCTLNLSLAFDGKDGFLPSSVLSWKNRCELIVVFSQLEDLFDSLSWFSRSISRVIKLMSVLIVRQSVYHQCKKRLYSRPRRGWLPDANLSSKMVSLCSFPASRCTYVVNIGHYLKAIERHFLAWVADGIVHTEASPLA